EATVRVLLAHEGTCVNQRDSNRLGMTPIACAASRGNEAMVRLLLEDERVLTSLKDYQGNTVLHIAEDITRMLLLHAKTDVNFAGRAGPTPLHGAILAQQEPILQLLLDHPDIDPNPTDKYGRTPLHLA
ncbi:ankyrin repeat-containing domain protein, partial [Tuber borchii]